MFSFSVGVSTIIITLLFYLKYRKKVLINLCLFVTSISCTILWQTIDFYGTILSNKLPKILLLIQVFVDTIGAALFVANTPFLFTRILGLTINKFQKIIFAICGLIILFGGSYLDLFGINKPILLIIARTIIFITFIYCVFLVIHNFKNLANRVLKSAMKVFFIFSILVIPIVLIPPIKNHPWYHSLPLPLYLFIINILCIVFIYKYFNQPVFLQKNILTNHFLKSFNITDRETEIIAHLLKGFTNKEISDKLFVSYKTIETHLSNIYRKTDVNNRIQLINLIQTNRDN